MCSSCSLSPSAAHIHTKCDVTVARGFWRPIPRPDIKLYTYNNNNTNAIYGKKRIENATRPTLYITYYTILYARVMICASVYCVQCERSFWGSAGSRLWSWRCGRTRHRSFNVYLRRSIQVLLYYYCTKVYLYTHTHTHTTLYTVVYDRRNNKIILYYCVRVRTRNYSRRVHYNMRFCNSRGIRYSCMILRPGAVETYP